MEWVRPRRSFSRRGREEKNDTALPPVSLIPLRENCPLCFLSAEEEGVWIMESCWGVPQMQTSFTCSAYICLPPPPDPLLHMCFEVVNQGSLLLFSHPLKSHRKRNVISLSSYKPTLNFTIRPRKWFFFHPGTLYFFLRGVMGRVLPFPLLQNDVYVGGS